jgi:hypothetical protein
MKARCYRKKHKNYSGWGGRGIKVCDRWLHSFENFFADMGRCPSDKESLDRLDPNGDYSPENCRWATMQQQGGENRRGLVPITVRGVTFQNVKAACAAFGKPYTVTMNRLAQGYDPELAFFATRKDLAAFRPRESYWRRSLRHNLP